MGKITIISDRPDDLYFLDEMARRLGLNSEIDAGTGQTGIGRIRRHKKALEHELAGDISFSGMKNIGEILKSDPGEIF